MNSSNYTSNGGPPNISLTMSIPVSIRFWLYLIPNVLSIICSIFVLYHLLFDRTLRQALHNHVIIVLLFAGLIYELTTVPLMLYYYHFGNTWKLSIRFSRFWTFIDSVCYTTQLTGFAWATIERHILVFHYQWMSTKKKCFFVHYLPLIAILVYCLTYHIIFILFPFCGDLNFPSPTNGVPVPCILIDPVLGKWGVLCHQIIPTFTIVIFSLALLLRVLKQKNRLNRWIGWRKQRKMTVQLLSISVLYFLFSFPRSIMQLFIRIGLLDLSTSFFYDLTFFAIYIIFLFPFVCCGSTSEIGKKLKKLFWCRKQRRVIVPEVIPMDLMEDRRMNRMETNIH